MNSPFENHIDDFQGWWNSGGFGGVSVDQAVINSFAAMNANQYYQYRVERGTKTMHWAY
jgi:hypothetical protein